MDRPRRNLKLVGSGAGLFLLATLILAAAPAQLHAAQPEGNRRPLVLPELGPELPRPRTALAVTAPPGGSLEDVVSSCVQQDMAHHNTPGAAVAVAVDGALAYQGGFGVRKRGGSQPVDAHTVFRIGSITKMLTAAGLLQLVETGAVHLDDPVTAYIPDFELATPGEASTITVEELLTHSSEIPDFYGVGNVFHQMTLDQWIPHMANLDLYAPAGSFWNYSNPNFSLAGLIIQRVSGMGYRRYMAEHVFGPAGMTSTTFDGAEVVATGDYSWGHQYDPSSGTETVYGPTAYDSETLGPAGMAFSTAPDLVRWALLLMDGGAPVLGRAMARRMQEPHVWTHTYPSLWYGYGIFAEDFEGLAVRQHGGNIPGWGAFLLWVPEHRFAVAILANTFEALDDAAYCIADGVLAPTGTTPSPPQSDPSTWGRYRGAYAVYQYDGSRLRADVRPAGDHLELVATAAPDLVQRLRLDPLYRDTFVTDTDGDGKPDLDLTFITPPGSSTVLWMRNRLLVGTRQAAARRPAGRAGTTDGGPGRRAR